MVRAPRTRTPFPICSPGSHCFSHIGFLNVSCEVTDVLRQQEQRGHLDRSVPAAGDLGIRRPSVLALTLAVGEGYRVKRRTCKL